MVVAEIELDRPENITSGVTLDDVMFNQDLIVQLVHKI